MYVRWWMCIRASEESVSCAANTTFSPQKTADILSYPQRQRAKQKRDNAYLHLLQGKEDRRSSPCNWQESISGSCNWLISCQLDIENFRSLIRPDKC